MPVEDKLDVTAANFAAAVLSLTVIRGIDEQNHERAKTAYKNDDLVELTWGE
jgi:hypothetical protein